MIAINVHKNHAYFSAKHIIIHPELYLPDCQRQYIYATFAARLQNLAVKAIQTQFVFLR